MLLEIAQQEGRDPSAVSDDLLSRYFARRAENVGDAVPTPEPPEQTGEDPRMANLREIEQHSQFMNPKPSGRDFLREGRDTGCLRNEPPVKLRGIMPS